MIRVRMISENPPRDGAAACADANHRWKTWATRGKNVICERCSKCGAERDRTMTPAERQHYGDPWPWSKKSPDQDVHWLWHKFCRAMQDKNGKWKKQGWSLMQAVRRFAEKHANDGIRITGCDDSYFASSDLVIIDHKARDEWMGSTVLVLSQCSGQPPAEFFLYPGHVDGLIQALQAVKKEQRRLAPLERAKQRAEASDLARIEREQKGRLVVLPIKRTRMTARVLEVTPPRKVQKYTVPANVLIRLSEWKPQRIKRIPYRNSVTLLLTEFPAEIRSRIRAGMRLSVWGVRSATHPVDLALNGWEVRE